MNWPIIVLIGTQLLFSIAGLLARTHMPKQDFVLASFLSWWFALFFLMNIIGIFGLMYVLTKIELGKSMALLGATSIIFANILGFLVLEEVLTLGSYIGISLAILAFITLALV